MVSSPNLPGKAHGAPAPPPVPPPACGRSVYRTPGGSSCQPYAAYFQGRGNLVARTRTHVQVEDLLLAWGERDRLGGCRSWQLHKGEPSRFTVTVLRVTDSATRRRVGLVLIATITQIIGLWGSRFNLWKSLETHIKGETI